MSAPSSSWIRRAGLAALLLAACRGTAAPAPDVAAGSGPPALVQALLGPTELMEQLFGEMERDPRFSAAGDRLWQKLEDDPALAARGNAIVEEITSDPAFQRWLVRELGKAKDPQQFAAAMDARIEAALANPVLNKTIEKGLQALMDRPEVDRMAERWAERMVQAGRVNEAAATVFLSPRWRKAWERILGPQSSDTALFLRVDRYLGSPAGKREAGVILGAVARDPLAKDLFLRLIEAPDLERLLVKALVPLLEDRTFGKRSGAVVSKMMMGTPTEALLPEVRAILELPAVIEAMRTLVRDVGDCEPINRQMGRDLRDLVLHLRDREDVLREIDPGLQASLAPSPW